MLHAQTYYTCLQQRRHPKPTILKDAACLNVPYMLVTEETSQVDKTWLKTGTRKNISLMLFKEGTSHSDKSWLNVVL